MKSVKELIEFIYGSESAGSIEQRVRQLMSQWAPLMNVPSIPRTRLPLSENDVVMISYGDSIRKDGVRPLQALKEFADLWLKDLVSGIHILPFCPYTSDDGFSVVDYREIDPDLGNWEDVENLGEKFGLMFDLVLNHCSVSSPWFQGFLNGADKYKDYFHTVSPGTDLSSVFRPRALPLLTEFDTPLGRKAVWTTFSPDQADLNFSNPDVLLEFLDIFLLYASRGARIIRLDAIGFLWKEIGTSCMHHPKTHAVVQLYRAVLNEIAPHVILLTETNVPHKENISYFGDGTDEAHMVYQFTLPPLTLDAYIRESALHLTEWALSLPETNSDHTYFNFMSSHDGIGVLPSRGYLSDAEVDHMIDTVLARGGKVSYKSTPEGEIPYELNINYRDAVNHPDLPDGLKARQFLSSQAVMLSMAGVPGIYVHSLMGSGNWQKGVEESGINRRINREKLDSLDLIRDLEEEDSMRHRIYIGFRELLRIRRTHPAFNPASPQTILKLEPEVFALIRTAYDNSESVLCLQNTSRRRIHMTLDGRNCPVPLPDSCTGLTEGGSIVEAEEGAWEIILEPYDVCWVSF